MAEPLGADYYVSHTGTVHLATEEEGGPGMASVLVCSLPAATVLNRKHLNNMRWGGYPPLQALEDQWVVEKLAGKKHKWQDRVPRFVCVKCFPVRPGMVGVL